MTVKVVRRAEENEFEAVKQMYWDIIDAMKGSNLDIMWEKDLYPSNDMIKNAIAAGEMFVLDDGGTICGAMVFNEEGNESYINGSWGVDAAQGEFMVIHALGVHPDYQGKGCGGILVDEAAYIAKAAGKKAVRLDVLGNDVPAIKLYESKGYEYHDTIRMYYVDTGWTDFLLYEKVL